MLLKAAPGLRLGRETVEAASTRPQHFFDILDLLRAHDPTVPISKAAMANILRSSFDVIQTIEQLRKYVPGLTLTEGVLKSVAQNVHSNEATIMYLCDFQKKQSPEGKPSREV